MFAKGEEMMNSEVALKFVFLLLPPFQGLLRDADENTQDNN